MTNPNDPASPQPDLCNEDETPIVSPFPGLTKREFIAVLAMQSILSGSRDAKNSAIAAAIAVEQADALIAALNA